VWKCEGVSMKCRTELYVLLCVGSWTFGKDCEGDSRKWRTKLYLLLCVGSWRFCVGVWGGQQDLTY